MRRSGQIALSLVALVAPTGCIVVPDYDDPSVTNDVIAHLNEPWAIVQPDGFECDGCPQDGCPDDYAEHPKVIAAKRGLKKVLRPDLGYEPPPAVPVTPAPAGRFFPAPVRKPFQAPAPFAYGAQGVAFEAPVPEQGGPRL